MATPNGADVALSVEFKLYLITDYQRLKAKEQELLGWSAKRELAKINYRIHTDAIKENLVPSEVTRDQMNAIYASEADVLNVALFGKTHQEWQRENPGLKGNQRDYATATGPHSECRAYTSNLTAPQASTRFYTFFTAKYPVVSSLTFHNWFGSVLLKKGNLA